MVVSTSFHPELMRLILFITGIALPYVLYGKPYGRLYILMMVAV